MKANRATMNRSPDARFIVLVYCPNCGSPVSSNDGSCRSCHSVFEEGACCSHCGEHVNPDTDICDSCGAAFTTFYEHECPSCKHGVSESAKGCPNCNATFFKPLKRRVNRSSSKRSLPKQNAASPQVEVKKEIDARESLRPMSSSPAPAPQPSTKDVPIEQKMDIPNLESSPPSGEPSPSPMPQIDVLADAQPITGPSDPLVLPEEPKKKGLFSFLRKKKPAPQSASTPPQDQPPVPGPRPVPTVQTQPEPTLTQLLSPVPEPQPPSDIHVPQPHPVSSTPVQETTISPVQPIARVQSDARPHHREPKKGKFFLHLKSHETQSHTSSQTEQDSRSGTQTKQT